MLLVQDLSGKWVGRPAFAPKVAGNRPPVAIADAFVVEANGPTVKLAVLDNDIDPEGGALTLVSAFAALGTAVAEADGRISYTPPAGLTGFDSIVYDVADALGQIDTGQADISLVTPALNVLTTVDNRLEVEAATGTIDITVTTPAEFAGTYAADLADLAAGPVNLVKPKALGTVADGATLTAAPGLWIHAAAETPVRSWQWLKDDISVPGGTGTTLTLGPGDVGAVFDVVETLSTASGSRSVGSGAVSSPAFSPADDAGVLGWFDAAEATTITESGGAVSAWASRSGAMTLTQISGGYQPQTGVRSIGGLNALDFGSADRLVSGITLPQGDQLAIHMAVTIDGVGSAYSALVSMDGAAADFQFDAETTGAFGGRLNVTGIGSSLTLSGGPFAGAQIVSILFDRTGAGEAEVFVGGISRGAMTMTAALDTAQTLAIFSNRSQNSSVLGAAGEIVITTSLDNRAAYHAYFGAKWGIS